MDKMPSERHLSESQRGSRRRDSMADGSSRSYSARNVNQDDRSRRRRSLLQGNDESESESEQDLLTPRRSKKDNVSLGNSSHHSDKMMQLPTSLLPTSLQVAGGAQLAPVASSLRRTTQSVRGSRSSVKLPDGAHSMRSGRTTVVLQDIDSGNKILDRRRSSMLQANQRLSRRSLLMETSCSERHLTKSPKKKLPRRTESMGDSMADAPLQSPPNNSFSGSVRGCRSADASPHSVRGTRSVDGSRREGRSVRATRSMDSSSGRSSRSVRRARTSSKGRDKQEKSLSRAKEKSTRGKRSTIMKDLSDPSTKEKSTRGKRSTTMKDLSDQSEKSTRSKRSGMADRLDSGRSSRGKRTTGGAPRGSERSRRAGRTISATKSSSPSRSIKKCATSEGRSPLAASEPPKKSIKSSYRSKSVGTLGELIMASKSMDQGKSPPEKQNFDWASHRAKVDQTDEMKRPDKKISRRMKNGSKRMARTLSTESFRETDEEQEPRRKSGKATRTNSSRSLTDSIDGEKRKRRGKKPSSCDGSGKYKQLDSNVMTSSYSAGSLGVLMATKANEKSKETKEKNDKYSKGLNSSSGSLSASGTLSLLAMGNSSTGKMSEVFGVKSAVANVRQAGRLSVVNQWLSPTEVAAAALAKAGDAKKESFPPTKKSASTTSSAASVDNKKPVPDIKHSSYNDAMVTQWLKT